MSPRVTFSCIAALIAPLHGDQAAEQLVLATYKLGNPSSTATGLAVTRGEGEGPERRFVVTARHVLEQMEGDTCQLVGRTANPDGSFRRKEHRVPIRAKGQALWTGHACHDLAVLPIPDGMSVEALPFQSLASEGSLRKVHSGDAVRLAVFPERTEANGAGFPVLRSGSIASYPVIPFERHPVMLVDATAWPGDSGGPVMHAGLRTPEGAPLVIGVVLGMKNITDTTKESRFVERKTHYPLGLSEVLHAAFARDLVLKASRDNQPSP